MKKIMIVLVATGALLLGVVSSVFACTTIPIYKSYGSFSQQTGQVDGCTPSGKKRFYIKDDGLYVSGFIYDSGNVTADVKKTGRNKVFNGRVFEGGYPYLNMNYGPLYLPPSGIPSRYVYSDGTFSSLFDVPMVHGHSYPKIHIDPKLLSGLGSFPSESKWLQIEPGLLKELSKPMELPKIYVPPADLGAVTSLGCSGPVYACR